MKNLDENDLKVLFKALGQILHNQDKINKHFGINKHDYDWGYEDTETEDLSHECFVIAQEYKDIIEEWDQERRKEYERCGDDPMIDFLMEVIPT
ncbi:MAG: hypothetical protein ACLRMG_00925 [Clostridium sp.]|jgi:hypothetical protein